MECKFINYVSCFFNDIRVNYLSPLSTFLTGGLIVFVIVATIKQLLKKIWNILPECIKDTSWYYFYTLPRIIIRRKPEKILLKLLDKKNIAVFLEMDYQYSEQLVKLYDKFYTNYVVIWDRLKNDTRVYKVLRTLTKSKMIETFKKNKINRENVHIRLSPSLSESRKLETIIINDRQEFGRETQNIMKLFERESKIRCFVVPMLTEEVIDYATMKSSDVKKVLIFTILEIPSEKQFKGIEQVAKEEDKIIYMPIISQEIIKDYYKEKYNKER